MDRMNHYTITAPAVRNDGTESGYAAVLRALLLQFGIDGWTEHESVGYWHGRREAGTVFTLYRMPGPYTPSVIAADLARIARRAMPDQEAIQVTYHGSVLVVEG